jgi:acyl dehydratase
MALKMDVIGKPSSPITHGYSWKDTVLYALGVGAKVSELDFLFEGQGPKVVPSFAVVPSFSAMIEVLTRVEANLMMVVHGEQKIVLHRPIPPGGQLSTVAVVKGIYDKGKGASILVTAETRDEQGEPVFDNSFTIFVRGEGGFGGERGPEAVKADPLPRPADFSITETTAPEQALLYRLSGDVNPLHASPSFAKAAGFERPILHGLCTYGFATRAIVAGACGGDPARLKSFGARFAGTVLPGDTLTTSGWQVEPGSWIIETKVGERTVLSNATAHVS